jgi:bifunctional DNA-binding transcriptional regulator/antitoxin component of YhaV-PrlF toxin-antitoxin module
LAYRPSDWYLANDKKGGFSMNFEIKRKIDELGRLVLPIDLRRYYGIESGDTIILLPVREGIQIAKAEFFIMNQLPQDVATKVDDLGRIVIPLVFRNQYKILPKDTMCLVPNETCMLMLKDNTTEKA